MLKNEDLDKICVLAKLSIANEQREEFLEKLNGTFDWIKTLEKIDVSGVIMDDFDYTTNPSEMKDEAIGKNLQQDVLANTKFKKYGMFCVPKVVE